MGEEGEREEERGEQDDRKELIGPSSRRRLEPGRVLDRLCGRVPQDGGSLIEAGLGREDDEVRRSLGPRRRGRGDRHRRTTEQQGQYRGERLREERGGNRRTAVTHAATVSASHDTPSLGRQLLAPSSMPAPMGPWIGPSPVDHGTAARGRFVHQPAAERIPPASAASAASASMSSVSICTAPLIRNRVCWSSARLASIHDVHVTFREQLSSNERAALLRVRAIGVHGEDRQHRHPLVALIHGAGLALIVDEFRAIARPAGCVSGRAGANLHRHRSGRGGPGRHHAAAPWRAGLVA